jgi:hypothetical protein
LSDTFPRALCVRYSTLNAHQQTTPQFHSNCFLKALATLLMNVTNQALATLLEGRRGRHNVDSVDDITRRFNLEDFAEGEGLDNIEALDEEQYNRISQMYIVDQTRQSYRGSNRRLLLWLDENAPECVSQSAKDKLQLTYETALLRQRSANKYTNKKVIDKADELILNAGKGDDPMPIVFGNVSDRIFMKFLFAMARKFFR